MLLLGPECRPVPRSALGLRASCVPAVRPRVPGGTVAPRRLPCGTVEVAAAVCRSGQATRRRPPSPSTAEGDSQAQARTRSRGGLPRWARGACTARKQTPRTLGGDPEPGREPGLLAAEGADTRLWLWALRGFGENPPRSKCGHQAPLPGSPVPVLTPPPAACGASRRKELAAPPSGRVPDGHDTNGTRDRPPAHSERGPGGPAGVQQTRRQRRLLGLGPGLFHTETLRERGGHRYSLKVMVRAVGWT